MLARKAPHKDLRLMSFALSGRRGLFGSLPLGRRIRRSVCLGETNPPGFAPGHADDRLSLIGSPLATSVNSATDPSRSFVRSSIHRTRR